MRRVKSRKVALATTGCPSPMRVGCKAGEKPMYPVMVVSRAGLQAAQRSTELAIPKVEFQNLVKEICRKWGFDVKFTAGGLGILQEAGERCLTSLYEKINLKDVPERGEKN